jgi:hypothetical protein
MICSQCKKEKSYFDMQPMPLTEEQKTYPVTPVKSLVCYECLGWEKPKVYYTPNLGDKKK